MNNLLTRLLDQIDAAADQCGEEAEDCDPHTLCEMALALVEPEEIKYCSPEQLEEVIQDAMKLV